MASPVKLLPRAVRIAGTGAMLVAVAHALSLARFGYLIVTRESVGADWDSGNLFAGLFSWLEDGFGYAALAGGPAAAAVFGTFAYVFARGYRTVLLFGVFPALGLLWAGSFASANLPLRPWLWTAASLVAAGILLGGAIGYAQALALRVSEDDPLREKLALGGLAIGGAASALFLAFELPRHPDPAAHAWVLFWTVDSLAKLEPNPNVAVKGFRCVTTAGSCRCSGASDDEFGTCGVMPCCYEEQADTGWAVHGARNGELGRRCYCDPPDASGSCHPVGPRNGSTRTYRVKRCP